MKAAIYDIKADCANHAVILFHKINHMDFIQYFGPHFFGSSPHGQHHINVDKSSRIFRSPPGREGNYIALRSPCEFVSPFGKLLDYFVGILNVFG